MADNEIVVQTKNIATDEIAGADYQRIKLIHGADGVNDGDVASGNPLPITGAITISSGTITGDVGITGVAEDGAAATIKRFNKKVSSDDTELIPAPTGTKAIQIRSLHVFALSETQAKFYLQTETTHTDVLFDSTNPWQVALDADGNDAAGVVLPYNPDGPIQAADNDEAVHVRFVGTPQAVWFSGSYVEV